MDYPTYQKIRSYCWIDLHQHIDTDSGRDSLRLFGISRGWPPQFAAINFEKECANSLFHTMDITPRELAAAELLFTISHYRLITWWREPSTPDGSAPSPPLEPWQTKESWDKIATALRAYCAFIPEREAEALERLIPRLVAQYDAPAPAIESGPTATALPEQTTSTRLSKRENQIRTIEAAISKLGLNAMRIPTGQKNNVRDECKRASKLFGAGIDPFKEAWQEAVNQKRVRMDKHTAYARK